MIIFINYKLHKIVIIRTIVFIVYSLYSYSKINQLL